MRNAMDKSHRKRSETSHLQNAHVIQEIVRTAVGSGNYNLFFHTRNFISIVTKMFIFA